MSGFVNYKKRSFVLPPGCIDLHDLLIPKASRKKQPLVIVPKKDTKALVTHESSACGTLADIKEWVVKASNSRAQWIGLEISIPDTPYEASVYRMEASETAAFISFSNNNEMQLAVRKFYKAHGLHLPSDSAAAASLFWDIPYDYSYPIYPMPMEHEALSNLIKAFFLEVPRLNEGSKIVFRLSEASSIA